MKYEQIDNLLLQIKNETTQGGNTRIRVYNALSAILEYAKAIGIDNSNDDIIRQLNTLQQKLSQHEESSKAHEAIFQEIKNIIKEKIGAITPEAGEKFYNKDSLRRLNYVSDFESDTTTFEGGAFAFNPINSAKMDKLTSIPNSLFKRSNLSYGSFKSATMIDTAAFAETGIYYINKPDTKEEWNLLLPNVEGVKSYAFYGCHSLIEVYLPKAIGVSNWAFADCIRLKKLELPVCDTFLFSAVANCIQLEELILPMQRSMYKAGYERLFGCTGLKKVVMPVLYEMDEFLNNMFADCIALEEVDIRTMKFIPSHFFSGKKKLHTVDISGAGYINRNAFDGCTSLKNITIKNAVAIWEYTFNNCHSIKELSLPRVHTFARKTLANMDSLTTLTIGAPVINSWDYSTLDGAVYNCPSLTTINVPDGLILLDKQVNGLSFVRCPNISKDSVLGLFNKLADNTGKSVKNIALEAVVLKNITDEELNIAKNKNYNIVRLGE